jgi:hypothetical protein
VNQQFETADYPVPIDHPNFLGNSHFFLKEVDINVVISAKPILKRGAKRTDLLNGTVYGAMGKLLISSKLKGLLEKANHKSVQYIQTSITHKEENFPSYWFTNPFDFNNELINFRNSTIEIEGVGGIKLRDISINNFEEYTSIANSLVMPERLSIKKLVLQNNIQQDLILLIKVYGGIGYYVSEKLKQEIEATGCTGIVFEPVEQG